jgi:DNA-binding response OmpR family regulator
MGANLDSLKRILVAEDDPQLGPLVARFLRSEGFQVTLARDGKAAWELVKLEPFDLIITDTHMPGLGGPELVALVRERYPAVPMIHMTGSSEADGNRDYPTDVPNLHKPFDFAALLRTISSVMSAA